MNHQTSVLALKMVLSAGETVDQLRNVGHWHGAVRIDAVLGGRNTVQAAADIPRSATGL